MWEGGWLRAGKVGREMGGLVRFVMRDCSEKGLNGVWGMWEAGFEQERGGLEFCECCHP